MDGRVLFEVKADEIRQTAAAAVVTLAGPVRLGDWVFGSKTACCQRVSPEGHPSLSAGRPDVKSPDA